MKVEDLVPGLLYVVEFADRSPFFATYFGNPYGDDIHYIFKSREGYFYLLDRDYIERGNVYFLFYDEVEADET